jgi:opacity protein-like surface antigen
MRKLFSMALLLPLFASIALAQTTRTSTIPVTDKLGSETFIGYTNFQAEGLPPTPTGAFSNSLFGNRTGMHGIVSEYTYYFTRHVGITGDFSWNQRGRSFTTTTAGGATLLNSLNTRIINILAGPQVRFPNQTRAVPFLRAMFGVANTRFQAQAEQTTTGGTFTSSFDTSSTDFAMMLGGGLDILLNNNVGLRIFQIDYNPVFLRSRSINVLGLAGAIQPQRLESNRQDNLRIGVGITLR